MCETYVLCENMSSDFYDHLTDLFEELGADHYREENHEDGRFVGATIYDTLSAKGIRKGLKNGKVIRLYHGATLWVSAPQYESGGKVLETNNKKVKELYENGEFTSDFYEDSWRKAYSDKFVDEAKEMEAKREEIENRIHDFCSEHGITYGVDEDSCFQYGSDHPSAYIEWEELGIYLDEDDFKDDKDLDGYGSVDWSVLDEYDDWGSLPDAVQDALWADSTLTYEAWNLAVAKKVEYIIHHPEEYREECAE